MTAPSIARSGTSRLRAALLATEAIVCFALPTYIWLWGVITTPLWYFAAARVGSFPFLHVAYIVGGAFGLAALIAFVRYLSRQDADAPFSLTRNVVFACAGLLSMWGYVTTDFEYFDVNGFAALAAGLPSLCLAHMIFLCLRKIRSRNSTSSG